MTDPKPWHHLYKDWHVVFVEIVLAYDDANRMHWFFRYVNDKAAAKHKHPGLLDRCWPKWHAFGLQEGVYAVLQKGTPKATNYAIAAMQRVEPAIASRANRETQAIMQFAHDNGLKTSTDPVFLDFCLHTFSDIRDDSFIALLTAFVDQMKPGTRQKLLDRYARTGVLSKKDERLLQVLP